MTSTAIQTGNLVAKPEQESSSLPPLHGKCVSSPVASFVRSRGAYRHPIPAEVALRGGRWQICELIARFSAIERETRVEREAVVRACALARISLVSTQLRTESDDPADSAHV